MRLVFDLRILDDHFPGIARYGYELALALARLPGGPELICVLPAAPRTRLDLAPLREAAAWVPSSAAVFGLGQHREIGALLRRLRPDAALFPYYVRPLWAPCPALTVIHDTISWRAPESFAPATRLQIRLLHHLALARSARVLTVSRSAAADLAQFYSVDPRRITVTSEAAAPQFAPPPPERIAALRARHGLPARYVAYLASDKPHKNIRLLLDAWARAETGDVGLVLGGRWFDPASEELLAAPGLAGRVWRLADVPEAELPALYGGALALAFPSRYEGFGLPAVEAMACGAPVLAADRSSLPEVVGDAGLL
ncbi:MAG TPA: glycosyltransferase family 1 protein, partial [Herpetosiphonaceae bacterium]